jgi:hypothetical protein
MAALPSINLGMVVMKEVINRIGVKPEEADGDAIKWKTIRDKT